MENDNLQKDWQELMARMSEEEISLGECDVTLSTIDGSVAMSITNSYGAGFDIVIPGDLPDNAKEALLDIVDTANMGFGKEGLKHALIHGYTKSLLPHIPDNMREEVTGLDPLKASLAIVSYNEMLMDAIDRTGVNELILGPDGDIYSETDEGMEMMFVDSDMIDQIMRLSKFERDEAVIMKRWLPKVAGVFPGLFPGFVCEPDACAVKVRLMSRELGMTFSIAIASLGDDVLYTMMENMMDGDDYDDDDDDE